MENVSHAFAMQTAANDHEKSVYRVLSHYMKSAKKSGNYVNGYIDGNEKLEAFLSDYYRCSKTKFIVRSSCKKNKDYSGASIKSVPCTRYGKEDRIYWEFNNRNLVVPFTGTPFITNSSQVKHCQHGSQYYKLRSQKIDSSESSQQISTFPDDNNTNIVRSHKRTKPSKKRNCPAYMCIREIVLFPQFALTPEQCMAPKNALRKEKATMVNKLKAALSSDPIHTLNRFFLHIPLPEAHADHPTNAGMASLRPMDPFVKDKIDELLATGAYEVRHIQLIVHDYVSETLLKNEITGFQTEPLLFPTEQEISDYIYLTSLTASCENASSENDKLLKVAIQDEMNKSVQELMSLVNSCSDEEALNKAKAEMAKVVCRVKKSTAKGFVVRDRHSLPPKQPSKFNVSQVPQQPLPMPNANISCQNPGMLLHQPPPNDELDNTLMLPSITMTQHDMLPSFSRLMESADPVMMPSLDDRLMGQNTDFHHGSLSNSMMHDLRTPQHSFLK